jgi:hypothetical protein
LSVRYCQRPSASVSVREGARVCVRGVRGGTTHTHTYTQRPSRLSSIHTHAHAVLSLSLSLTHTHIYTPATDCCWQTTSARPGRSVCPLGHCGGDTAHWSRDMRQTHRSMREREVLEAPAHGRRLEGTDRYRQCRLHTCVCVCRYESVCVCVCLCTVGVAHGQHAAMRVVVVVHRRTRMHMHMAPFTPLSLSLSISLSLCLSVCACG